MALSKCSKCENRSFEVVDYIPAKSNYKLMFVQCSSCGSVVGTMDYYNIGTLINKLEKKIDNISSSSNTEYSLSVINQNITKLFRLINNLKSSIDKK